MLVLLQSADGPSLGNRTFDGSLQGARLVMTIAENHYLSGSHHGTHTYGQSETKTRFAWVGEVQNERLQAGLEKLSVDDLKLLTLYAYEGYTVTEISKVLGVSHPTISIKIKRITNFLKKFDFDAMD